MSVKLLTDQHLEFLSLKGGCKGSSESTIAKMAHCWKSHVSLLSILSKADPGFLERGFIYIKVWGFALLILSHFSQIFNENEIILSHRDQIISFS